MKMIDIYNIDHVAYFPEMAPLAIAENHTLTNL